MKTRSLIFYVIPLLFSVTSCGSNEGPAKKAYFTLWNENVSTSLTTLKNFVNDVTDEKSKNFIPVEDRIATFDMDGTFVGELYPTYFEYNLLNNQTLQA